MTVTLTARSSSLRMTLVVVALDQVAVASSPASRLRVQVVRHSLSLTSGAILVIVADLVSLSLDPVAASHKDPVVLDLVASLMTATQETVPSKEMAVPLVPLKTGTMMVATLTLVLLREETTVMMPVPVLLRMMLIVISLRTVLEMVVSRKMMVTTMSRVVTLVVVPRLRRSVVVVGSN